MARPTSSSRRGGDARVEIARRQLGEPGGKALNRAADTMREINQHGERYQPEAGGEHDIGEQKSALQVALLHVRGECAGVVDLAFQTIHAYVREVNRVEPDFRAASLEVFERIAIHAGGDEVLRLIAISERFDGSRPLRTGLCRILCWRRRAGLGLLLELREEFASGLTERMRQRIQPVHRQIIGLQIEQRGGNPEGCAQGREGGRQKNKNEPVAKPVHPRCAGRPESRGRSIKRSQPVSRVQVSSPAPALRLKISIMLTMLIPRSPSTRL